ncbi:MAG: type IV pilus twitching motility protein PilT [Proteobacteria bacterium]|nr:type IV pilus twitching motility protein PilT [Pseudomonadota bacterium]
MDLMSLVNHAREHNASDIHISSNHPPMLRVMGDISYLNVPPLTQNDVMQILKSSFNDAQMERYQRDFELDSSIEVGKNLYRVNAYYTNNGPSIALRVIPEHIMTLGELKIPAIVEQFASMTRGLILVTGPCGSGKSTTLAAIINYINRNFSRHIITVEDPIEYRFQSEKSLVNQREIDTHTKSFSQALRSALREDPDIIMLGELRDLETIQLALTAAETGHLVLSTLHTSSAPKTIDRIIDVFPSADKPLIRTMLASSLEGIISQALIPKVDHKSRVATYEILVATQGIRNLIRENKVHQITSMMEIGSKYGMMLMSQHLKKLEAEGVINEAIAKELFIESLDENHKEGGRLQIDVTPKSKNNVNNTYADDSQF